MTPLSIFENFNNVVGDRSFDVIVEAIRTGKLREKVEMLRQLLQEGNQKEYSQSKKQLPAFTPSGRFEGGRKAEFLQEYSRLIILDIDKVENLAEITEKARNCPYTYTCFVSPGGNGLKILVKTDNSVQKHREAFLRVQQYYEKLLNTVIDPSGKDVTRLCFFSWDPELFINPESETFNIKNNMSIKSDIENLIEKIENHRLDITSNYDDWVKIGFAIESEFGESGRAYFHDISKYNPDYNTESCNEQYNKCLKNNNSGVTIKTLFHIAKQHGVTVSSLNKRIETNLEGTNKSNKSDITSNRFVIAEQYLSKNYVIRYNVVSNKFEYKAHEEEKYRELNENNLFIRMQKENVNLSLNNLISLLKSDFVVEYNPFREYFESLPEWDGSRDYIQELCNYLKTPDRERLNRHFKKWLVRAVKTATDDFYYNKQALVLVSTRQNSGKSTFCRFLCPLKLQDYIVENIGTDKDSLVAITENFLINLDELSTAEKAEINAFKSMFSKEKVKARLTYDKRASVHVRRASFIGSTDRWEFLTDENGSVRWLCFDISEIDWNYSKQVDINKVYAQAWHLLTQSKFEYELTVDEIAENDYINKKYQVSTPERDLIQRHLKPGTEDNGKFFTATDVLEFLSNQTMIKMSPERIGREMKFLGYERVIKYNNGISRYGYYCIDISNKNSE
ncbi:MAG: PriCT-2 domain-containing protein [Bacteroidales bacterium]|nr:PriCT-2 domain-containing protein [Bacteroidales bacterium]